MRPTWRAGLKAEKKPAGQSGTLYERYATHLPQGEEITVVVIAGAQAPERVREALASFAGARLHVLAADRNADWELEKHHARHHVCSQAWDMNRELKLIGPVDVLVDLELTSALVHGDRWAHLFFHLRHRGAWILPRVAIAAGHEEGMDSVARVAQLVAGDDLAPTTHRERTLGQATSAVLMTSDVTLVVKRDNHLAKFGEKNALRYLSRREPELQTKVMDRLPASTFRSGIEVVSHESEMRMADLETTFAVPEMQLRHYSGRIAVSANSLVYAGHSVLPESFRHPFERNLRTTRLVPSNATFGRVEDDFRPSRRRLSGTYYHLDASNPGHFGHVLTEVLSRLWGWHVAKAEIPDLKAIFRIRFPGERDPVLEKRLFAGMGIAAGDIVAIGEPVFVEALVGATPMMQNKVPYYVHPEIKDRIWRPVTDALREGQTGLGKRIFVSRRGAAASRFCRNAAKLESEFAAHGFVKVYPEDHDLAAQAAIFHEAQVIAGFGGSALFNAMHCDRLEHLIVLNSTGYTARNEQLYAAAQGARITYFWNDPDAPPVPGTWSNESYVSSWDFDFDRHRAALDGLFQGLG